VFGLVRWVATQIRKGASGEGFQACFINSFSRDDIYLFIIAVFFFYAIFAIPFVLQGGMGRCKRDPFIRGHFLPKLLKYYSETSMRPTGTGTGTGTDTGNTEQSSQHAAA